MTADRASPQTMDARDPRWAPAHARESLEPELAPETKSFRGRDTLYVPAVDQIMGGLECARRLESKQRLGVKPMRPAVSHCRRMLSECQARAEENEERSLHSARKARAGLLEAACGAGERPTRERRARPMSVDAASQRSGHEGRGAEPIVPASSSTAAPRTPESWPPKAASWAPKTIAGLAPPAATMADAFAGIAPFCTSAAAANAAAFAPGVPPQVQVVGPGLAPPGAVVPPVCARPVSTRSVSPAVHCRMAWVGAAEVAPGAHTLPGRAASACTAPAGWLCGVGAGLGTWAGAAPVELHSAAACRVQIPCMHAGALGTASPAPPAGCTTAPWPPMVDGGAVPVPLLLCQSPAAGAWPSSPLSGSASAPAPRPDQRVVVIGGPAAHAPEAQQAVAAHVTAALRSQAARQLFGCLRQAANRRACCAFGKWWRATARCPAVRGSPADDIFSKLAHYDNFQNDLGSMLDTAVAKEERKMACHDRTLALLLGLRQLHACLHMDHVLVRSAFMKLKRHSMDWVPDSRAGPSRSRGAGLAMRDRLSAVFEDSRPSRSAQLPPRLEQLRAEGPAAASSQVRGAIAAPSESTMSWDSRLSTPQTGGMSMHPKAEAPGVEKPWPLPPRLPSGAESALEYGSARGVATGTPSDASSSTGSSRTAPRGAMELVPAELVGAAALERQLTELQSRRVALARSGPGAGTAPAAPEAVDPARPGREGADQECSFATEVFEAPPADALCPEGSLVYGRSGPQAPDRSAVGRKTVDAAALGVAKEAGRRTVTRAFRKGALETHPDKGGSSSDFRVLFEAYQRMAGS